MKKYEPKLNSFLFGRPPKPFIKVKLKFNENLYYFL